MLRTHLAGELRSDNVGETVTLTGWVSRRRDHGGVIFIDLRDRSGVAQVVFRESEVADRAHALRSEYCVRVTGVVEARPEGSSNPNLASGDIEVNVSDLEILNESTALPFQIDDPASRGEVGEEIADGSHMAASEPGGTVPSSRAPGIGLIGSIGPTLPSGAMGSGPSVL